VDASYNERNGATTERLRRMRRLSDAEFARPVGEHWTVAVVLAYIGYWDARGLGPRGVASSRRTGGSSS
jgi:hypothetical protein